MKYYCAIDKGSSFKDVFNIIVVLGNEVVFTSTSKTIKDFNLVMEEVIENYVPLQIKDFTVK